MDGTRITLEWDAAWAPEKNPAPLSKLKPSDVGFVLQAKPLAMRARISPAYHSREDELTDAKLKAILMELVASYSVPLVSISKLPRPVTGGTNRGWSATAMQPSALPGDFQFAEVTIVVVGDIPVLVNVLFNKDGKAHAARVRDAASRLMVTLP